VPQHGILQTSPIFAGCVDYKVVIDCIGKMSHLTTGIRGQYSDHPQAVVNPDPEVRSLGEEENALFLSLPPTLQEINSLSSSAVQCSNSNK
jgi:hypothetical protein